MRLQFLFMLILFFLLAVTTRPSGERRERRSSLGSSRREGVEGRAGRFGWIASPLALSSRVSGQTKVYIERFGIPFEQIWSSGSVRSGRTQASLKPSSTRNSASLPPSSSRLRHATKISTGSIPSSDSRTTLSHPAGCVAGPQAAFTALVLLLPPSSTFGYISLPPTSPAFKTGRQRRWNVHSQTGSSRR